MSETNYKSAKNIEAGDYIVIDGDVELVASIRRADPDVVEVSFACPPGERAYGAVLARFERIELASV